MIHRRDPRFDAGAFATMNCRPAVVAFGGLLVAATLWLGLADAIRSAEPTGLSKEAAELHRQSLVFDGHNSLLMQLRKRRDAGVETVDLARFQQGLHTDIPRLQQGGVGAEVFATYVSSASVKQGTAVRETLEQIAQVRRLTERFSNSLELALRSSDVERIRNSGKVACMIAVEGGHAIDGSLAVLQAYHQAGARCLALTHDDTHGWADAALDAAKHNGLTAFGESVVRELNHLGMVIDLSHASVDTVEDTLKVSRAPVIFSHSGAAKLAPHPRNLPDAMLRQVAANGGVIHVNFFAGFLTAKSVEAYHNRSQAANELRKTFKTQQQFELALTQWLADNPLPTTTISDVVDHIDHIVAVAGIDHVGLGSNFDGMASVPRNLEDVSCFPHVTQELLRRGYTAEQVRKILGGNTLRVLRAVEDVAGMPRAPIAEAAGVAASSGPAQ
jgi:membrane dipeptidase